MTSVAYTRDEIAHDADLPVPLQHGYFRHAPSQEASLREREFLAPKHDKPFIYVPHGFTQRESAYFSKILAAMELELPNLVVNVAATEGTQEEQLETCYEIKDADRHPLAKEWTETHRKEVLVSKVTELLRSTMESSAEVGAWIIPQDPRRRNGAAQMICQALPKTGPPICLGLIALDHQDDQDGLRTAITTAMQPLGSPVREVARVVYDARVQSGSDGALAPCPQLSHVLFFESPHELVLWRDKLLKSVPDFLLAFGNLTEAAFGSVFQAVVDGSPVVLLKHTSPDVDNLCCMFKHAKQSFREKDQQPTTATQIPGAERKAGRTRLPPMEAMEDEQIRLFVSTWPLDYNPATTLCADPLIVTTGLFQKKLLAAISAAFDLKTGSEDFRKVRKRVLDYAWSFYDVVSMHATQKKRSTETLNILLLSFTLVSVIASVLYDQWYNGSRNRPKGTMQMILFVTTILLPLYVTALKQESDKSNPISKWNAFRTATCKLESEIFKFRCQVAPYRAHEKNEAAMRKTVKTFTDKTREIWASVQKHLADDGMDIPEDFWKEGAPLATTTVPNQTSQTSQSAAASHAAVPSVDTVTDEKTSLLAGIPSIGEAIDEQDEEDPDDVVTDEDDHYSPLKIDDYVKIRMNTVMGEAVAALDSMVKRNDMISNAIKLITVISGGAAALSLQWTVPIILGVTSALGGGHEFCQYPKRIELANQVVVRLNDLKLWWMGLSMYERQLPKNKDRLIWESEKVILHRCVSEFGGVGGDGSE